MPGLFQVSVKGVLVRGQQALLLEGNSADGKPYWDLPGGRLENGEQPMAGLLREIQEELPSLRNPEIDQLVFTELSWHLDDNLLFKDSQQVSAPEREAYAWLKAHTNPTDVILASPEEPWSVPLFTGRSLVRTNYWLSPADPLTDEVTAAFNGSLAAQEVTAGHADYIVLTTVDEPLWPLYDGGVPTFSNNDVKIFATESK